LFFAGFPSPSVLLCGIFGQSLFGFGHVHVETEFLGVHPHGKTEHPSEVEETTAREVFSSSVTISVMIKWSRANFYERRMGYVQEDSANQFAV
jgi:hypothetical protein